MEDAETRTVRRFAPVAFVIGAGILLVLALLLVFKVRPSDPRMPVRDAERALDLRVHNGVKYECERTENGGTIEDMKDVDYFCTPRGGDRCHPSEPCSESGYWIGTDRSQITEIRSFF